MCQYKEDFDIVNLIKINGAGLTAPNVYLIIQQSGLVDF